MQRVILVTGATGHVGRHVVSQLLGTDAAVRALARNPDSAGLPGGVEVVRGDLSVPNTLDRCLDGVEAVFLVWPGLPADFASAVLDAVRKHARRIVYLSSLSVRDDLEQQADPITAFHADIERLIEQSGLEWTFLRSSGLTTNTLGWAQQIRTEGVVRWPYGAAARSLIHEGDIASVAVRVLQSSGHRGAKYLLTGPQAHIAQAEDPQQSCQQADRHIHEEDGGPAKTRQEQATDAWSRDATQGSKRTDKAHGAPALAR